MEKEELKVTNSGVNGTDVVPSLAQHTFTPSPAQLPVFRQFINVDWNDPSVLNESYLVHLVHPLILCSFPLWTKWTK